MFSRPLTQTLFARRSPFLPLVPVRPFASATELESTMVDVSAKNTTTRKALAQCKIVLSCSDAYSKLKERELEKGDAIKIAEVAGLMASKRTWDLIPLCH